MSMKGNGSLSKKYFLSSLLCQSYLEKKGLNQRLDLFHHSSNNEVFLVYNERWKQLKSIYVLVAPISLAAHSKFYNIPDPVLGLIACTDRAKRCWSSDHFEEIIGYYFVSHNSLTVEEREIKAFLLPFIKLLISIREDMNVGSVEDKRKLFGNEPNYGVPD